MKTNTLGYLASALLLLLSVPNSFASAPPKHSIPGKVFVGYQGWFRCPGDGSPKNVWSHWSNGAPSPTTMSVDLYPDLTGIDPKFLCPVPGMTIGAKQAYLFSSFPYEVVKQHFEWMKAYSIDGAFLQRFVGTIKPQRAENDVVLKNVWKAAEETDRTFMIEYDLSGARPETVLSQLQEDWNYLSHYLGAIQSRAYLKDGDKPIVAIWGLGFNDHSHLQDPALVLQIVQWYHQQGVEVMGGVPSGWGTLNRDSSPNPAWNDVYNALDIVQPWTVGRYGSPDAADKWKDDMLVPDMRRTHDHKQLYMPVIFPGFSWHNLNHNSQENQIPRRGGDFLWHQARNAKSAGAPFVKIAMFDEVNEGTAIFKAAPRREDAPDNGFWLTLDADGMKLPSDWYLQLASKISDMFNGKLSVHASLPKPPKN